MADKQELPVRVWLAERAKVPGPDGFAKMDMQSFKKKLVETFVPVTYQAMQSFGLTAYIPTLWPYPAATDAPLDLPEESALVFYESVDHYKKIIKSPLGRLYFDAHSLLFGKGKNIAKNPYPQPYSADAGCDWNTPYYGGGDASVSWASGQVWALAWAYPKTLDTTDWVRDQILPHLSAFSLVSQWIAWSSTNWTVLWVHTGTDTAPPKEVLLGRTLFVHSARDVQVPIALIDPWTAVELDFDQTVRLNPATAP